MPQGLDQRDDLLGPVRGKQVRAGAAQRLVATVGCVSINPVASSHSAPAPLLLEFAADHQIGITLQGVSLDRSQ